MSGSTSRLLREIGRVRRIFYILVLHIEKVGNLHESVIVTK